MSVASGQPLMIVAPAEPNLAVVMALRWSAVTLSPDPLYTFGPQWGQSACRLPLSSLALGSGKSRTQKAPQTDRLERRPIFFQCFHEAMPDRETRLPGIHPISGVLEPFLRWLGVRHTAMGPSMPSATKSRLF